MTPQQITLIKQSWRSFRQVDPTILGDLFYSYLIKENPSVKSIFKYSLQKQSKLLMDFMNNIIVHLEKIDEMKSDFKEMSKLYAEYGILPQHYHLIKDALLWTMQQGLNNDWNKEVENAWICGSIEVMNLMHKGYTS